ncbi:unnamed protein product [Phytomonas sp. EM1]|nr:unnamed protein product [Phytomonas sp. EM1]|eukprot:CCW65468.1 unnamed protein product [Phytomonas sp. isolate EM1]
MTKANKSAKVKLFKYKTTLCQYYINNVECPFTDHCAFAHGDHELHDEENNINRLNAIGKKRLGNFVDILDAFSPIVEPSPPSDPPNPPPTLPSSAGDAVSVAPSERPCGGSVVVPPLSFGPAPLEAATTPSGSPARCQRHFSSACHREQPMMYRHNPYSLCVQVLD